jgi:hypothetical protein
MKSGKFWIAVLVAGVVANVVDYVGQGMVLTGMYYSKLTDVFRQDMNIGGLVFGDFVAVLVLAWVYDKVASAFGGGVKGGACCGFYLGVLVNFPAYHFINLMFKGYPYSLTWINTIYGIIWYVIVGAILAAVMKKAPAAGA